MFTTITLACMLENNNNKTFISVAKTNQAVENKIEGKKGGKKTVQLTAT